MKKIDVGLFLPQWDDVAKKQSTHSTIPHVWQ